MAAAKLDWLLGPLLCGLAMILAAGVKGFWWCLTYLLLSTAALFVLHARWRRLGVFVESADAERGSAKWLAGSRFVCWGVAFIGVGFPYHKWGFETFTTFTLWTWLNMFIYFSLVLLKSLWDLVRSSKLRLSSSLLLWFEVLYGMAWLVDAMYWIFLVPYDAIKEGSEGLARRTTRLNIYLHSLNVALMNVELANLTCGVNIYHSIFGIYFGVVYIGFNWIVHEVKGGWTYFFLDFNRDDAVPYLLLLQVVVVLSFGLGALLSRCMESFHTRRYSEAKDASPISDQDDAFRGVEMQPEPAYLGA
ncbi:hypothetical protein AK812_SmicGene15183 [Symbiodinium microadriaticum]|uniref:Uncharacterized protein n=1 Tax=Symbiodinium microadriaticum TaxID=2951 RepID=A0A1Q9E3M4_SYMMI|nr:hypothetical protein AK812_SmicGene15183 [Symbiodinium microadriaticum]